MVSPSRSVLQSPPDGWPSALCATVTGSCVKPSPAGGLLHPASAGVDSTTFLPPPARLIRLETMTDPELLDDIHIVINLRLIGDL